MSTESLEFNKICIILSGQRAIGMFYNNFKVKGRQKRNLRESVKSDRKKTDPHLVLSCLITRGGGGSSEKQGNNRKSKKN